MTLAIQTPSLSRLQRSAERLISRFGARLLFTEYSVVNDHVLGKTGYIAGVTIQAAATEDTVTEFIEGTRSTKAVLLIAAPPFLKAGKEPGPTWKVSFRGLDRQLGKSVLNEDGTYYVVDWGDSK